MLQSSQIVPVHLFAEFPGKQNTQRKIHKQAYTCTCTHAHCRINMDHTVPKGPNQLGQLSEMYTHICSSVPLQENFLCHVLSFVAVFISLSLPLERICSFPSKLPSIHISLCDTAPVSTYSFQNQSLFIASFYFPKRGEKRAAGRGTNFQKVLQLQSFLINRLVQ